MNQKMLDDFVQVNLHFYQQGQVANYIPALARVIPNQLGIAIYNSQTNEMISSGDATVRFAIESISKVPVLLLAIEDNGIEEVLKKVNTEPTGFAFNSILNMEINHDSRPLNPFVNAGAIVTSSLVKGKNNEDRFQRILSFTKELCDDDGIVLNEEIYRSEAKTGNINRSLAYYMKGNQMIEGDVDDILAVYFKQCSVEVTTQGIAKAAAVLANGGVAPWNQKQLVSKEAATLVKSIMTTAGLYDESGEFSAHVGIPAKSGVGGGLLGVAPNQFGIGVFSPPLDSSGNSTAGVRLLKDVVDVLDLNIFE